MSNHFQFNPYDPTSNNRFLNGRGAFGSDATQTANYNNAIKNLRIPGLPDTFGGGDVIPNAGSGGGGGEDGFGLNFKTLSAINSGLGGLGSLAQGFAAIKQLKLGKQQLDFKKDVFNQNFAAQRTTVNNRINDQNAFKTAQGRTDFAKLVI